MCLIKILILEEEAATFDAKLQQCDDLVYGHGSSVMYLCVLFQLTFDDGDGRVHWNRGDLYSIECNTLPFLMSDCFDLVYKCFCIPNVMFTMSYHWP